jgi:hypothetical protein
LICLGLALNWFGYPAISVRTARAALVQVSGRHLRSSSMFHYIAIVSLPVALTGDISKQAFL